MWYLKYIDSQGKCQIEHYGSKEKAQQSLKFIQTNNTSTTNAEIKKVTTMVSRPEIQELLDGDRECLIFSKAELYDDTIQYIKQELPDQWEDIIPLTQVHYDRYANHGYVGYWSDVQIIFTGKNVIYLYYRPSYESSTLAWANGKVYKQYWDSTNKDHIFEEYKENDKDHCSSQDRDKLLEIVEGIKNRTATWSMLAKCYSDDPIMAIDAPKSDPGCIFTKELATEK